MKNKNEDDSTEQKVIMIKPNILEQIDAGNNFVCFLSNLPSPKENITTPEIFIKGVSLSSLLSCDESSFDLSIDNAFIVDYKTSDDILKQISIHSPLERKDSKETVLSILSEYTPIQISAYNNSVAILLKSKDDIYCDGKFNDYKNIFTEINTNLKNKRETFQTYFLNNVTNEVLSYYDEKSMYIPMNETERIKDQSWRIYKNCYIYLVDFKEKMNELLGRSNKNFDNLFKELEAHKIIIGNKINVFKFFQVLKGYNSICNTKLIILGEFAKQWYNHFENENKEQWKSIYNGTLSFELPITLLPIKQVKMGNNHILLLTVEGEVYSMGDGSKGATGDKIRNFHCTPTKVEFPFPNTVIEKIAAGARHSLAVDSGNTLYSWGCGACGCLGLDSLSDAFDPKPVDFSTSGDIIYEIDAADNYSACLTNDGNLYTWGNSQFNRLGLSEGVNSKIPQKVKDQFAGVVTHVKCGYLTTLVQTNKNTVFGFGIQSLSDTVVEKRGEVADKENEPIIEKAKNKLYSFKISFKKKKSQKIVGMFVGNRFYGLVTYDCIKKEVSTQKNDDDINNQIHFYFGGDFKGFSNINIALKPMLSDCEQKIGQVIEKGFLNDDYKDLKKEKKAVGKKEIKKIVCSQNNTAILTYTGDVYVFGSYLYQVAQHENPYSTVQPRGIKVLHLALGANHILMVNSSKEVYVAGRNLEGQLGLGFTSKSVDIASAKSIEVFTHQGAKKCYAAENYSVVITMGTKSKVWVFGDIPFLQSSYHLNKQLSPKEMNWGEVDKIACGSTHMLLLVKGNDNLYTIMSVGNGMYGKLGDGDSTGKNQYMPVRVALPYTEIKYTRDVKLRCGKYTSGVLIKDTKNSDQNNTRYQLYMWGLCQHKLFENPKAVERKHTFGETFPIESTIPVIKPALITTYSVQDMAIGEGICYFIISVKNELEKIGEFYGRKNKGKVIIADEFKKVSLGLNHAAALSKTGKLFTWGSNIMNKLGFAKTEDKNTNILQYTINDSNDIYLDKYFVDVPSNVVKFNEIIEEQDKIQKDEEVNKLLQMNKEEETMAETIQPEEEETEGKEKETDGEKKEETKEEDDEDSDNDTRQSETVYAKAREIVRSSVPKFDQLERKLQSNENLLQKQLEDVLINYKILVEKTQQAKLCYKSLSNMFFFKFGDKPLNIKFKNLDKNFKKFPPQLRKHKKSLKALLSLLHTHPCYLLNIYQNSLFEDKELYKIVKQIFKGMRNDRFTQLIMITLCKEILAIDLKKKNITSLDELKLVDNDNELTLLGRLCKLLFRTDCNFTNRQEVAALYIIGNIFSAMDNTNECEDELKIKLNPEGMSQLPNLDINNYQRNARIKKILKQFEYFSNDLMNKSSLEKNNLFSLSNVSNYKPLFKLPEICLLLIQEIRTVLKTITPDDEKIVDWLGKNFGMIMFSHMIKVLENPSKKLSIDASLLNERGKYKVFMEKSKHNFFSVSYVFRFCLNYLSMNNSANMQDNEINKQIEKEYKNSVSSVLINIKNIILNKQTDIYSTVTKPPTVNTTKSFDLECLKEFFRHSLNDSNYVINISLYNLKRLLEVIIPNREKIRVLNKNYDVMEMILKETGLLEDEGLNSMDVGTDEDMIVQFKLRTKLLCLKNPMTLMKCRHCKSILLNDFIMANEVMFFEQFEFINQSSAKGKFIALLKDLDPIEVKSDKFNLFLKAQYEKKKEQYSFRDNLYQLFTLMAVDAKDDLYITEDIIADPEKLNQTMFSQNSPNTTMKKYCEDIVVTYEKMKEHIKYHQTLFDTLNEISKNIKDTLEENERIIKTMNCKADNSYPIVKAKGNETPVQRENFEKNLFLIDIYKKVAVAIQHGYANEEFENNNNLMFSCMFLKIQRHNDNLPKSEVIFENLPQEMKKSMESVREFTMKKLLEKGVVKNIHQFSDEIINDAQFFKLSMLKNEHFEFIVTLIQTGGTRKTKSQDSKSASNSKKLLTFTISNDILAKIIKEATKPENNRTVNLAGFIDVEPKAFLKILKKIFDIGFY